MEKLVEKLEEELEKFKQELRQKTPDEIMENAYQLTVKEEIIGQINEKNLDEKEIKALLKNNNLLGDLYKGWMKADGQLGESVSDSIDNTIEKSVKHYYQNKETRYER